MLTIWQALLISLFSGLIGAIFTAWRQRIIEKGRAEKQQKRQKIEQLIRIGGELKIQRDLIGNHWYSRDSSAILSQMVNLGLVKTDTANAKESDYLKERTMYNMAISESNRRIEMELFRLKAKEFYDESLEKAAQFFLDYPLDNITYNDTSKGDLDLMKTGSSREKRLKESLSELEAKHEEYRQLIKGLIT